jgi:predicted exporter
MALSDWKGTAIWLLLVLVTAWLVAARLHVATDLTAFMPHGQQPVERLLVQQLRQGPGSRLILAAIAGGSPEERAAASRALARQLRASGLFLRVLNGEQRIDTDEWQRVYAHRYLLSERAPSVQFSAASLRESLRQRLTELRSPLAMAQKKLLPADPTAVGVELAERWRPEAEPQLRDGIWTSAQGDRALLLLETRAVGLDLDEQWRTRQALEAAFKDVQIGPGMALALSGPSILAVESRALIRSDAQRLSFLATVFVAGLLVVAFRSARVTTLAALPLASGILAGLAAVILSFGEIHGITLAFGITVLGVAVDYPIHLLGHLTAKEQPAATAARLWPTLRLGVLTTVIGYSAMLGTEFPGLSQLGLFAIAGLAAAAAVTRWVLPELLMGSTVAPLSNGPGKLLSRLARPPRLGGWLVIAVGLGCVMFISRQDALWQDDLLALSPIPPARVALDRDLRTQLKAPDVRHLIVVAGADVEAVLERQEALLPDLRRLVEAGDIGGFDMAARYLPSRSTQRVRQAELPPREELAMRLRAAAEGLPFRPGLFEPFLDAVEVSRGLAPLEPKALEGSGLVLRLGSLLVEGESGWLGLVTLRDVKRVPTLTALANQPQTYYLDLKGATQDLVADFRETAVLRIGIGGLVMLGVLWLGLRSGRRLAAVIVPMAGAVAVAVAILLIMGERLNLFHLISLLLVVGVGCDYGLFFTRQRSTDGRLDAWDVRAVGLCAASTLVVFGLLASSEIPVLRAIGETVAVGVTAAFVFAWLSAPLARAGQHTDSPCDRYN